ncbi:hypothetical protein FA95DRAFT_1028584 [Auriscalpium vulgare]|uniref:Uncharacterized protein n=1 Tax=Auriscalpium vulgare TaxID=40419 RepID=A0ACB8R5H7_9AGAM|nr:hypothetical protein FA95DRAFT_1028584 [Auriscalpium vulgare]
MRPSRALPPAPHTPCLPAPTNPQASRVNHLTGLRINQCVSVPAPEPVRTGATWYTGYPRHRIPPSPSPQPEPSRPRALQPGVHPPTRDDARAPHAPETGPTRCRHAVQSARGNQRARAAFPALHSPT